MQATKIKDIVIYRDEDYYCGPGPAAVAFPDGELAVFFRRHRSWTPVPTLAHMHPATEQCIVRSVDAGHTWNDNPRVFHGGGQCACATRLRDGTLLFVTHRKEMIPDELVHQLPGGNPLAAMEPYLRYLREQDANTSTAVQTNRLQRKLNHWVIVHAGTEVWRSDDRGLSWQGPAWVEGVPDLPPILDGLHPPVEIRGFPVELRDGTVVLPVQNIELGAILAASVDGGRSWMYRGMAGNNPDGRPFGLDEWSVHETPSGDLVGFIRSESPPEEGGGYLWTARSSDRGHSWDEPIQHNVWGFPYFVQPLPSGHALMVYGYRKPPYGIRCRVLDPECERPEDAEEVVLRDDGGTRDLGYPHSTLMPDGRVLVVYYFNDREDGQRYIAGSIVEVT